MNSSDLNQLLDHFNSKIQTIHSLIPLSQLYEELSEKNPWNRNAVLDSNQFANNWEEYSKRLSDKKPDLREISQMVIEMKSMTQEIKLLIKQKKQMIVSQSIEYHNDLDRFQRHCEHINHNIPTFLQNSKPNKIVDKKTDLVRRPLMDQKNDASKLAEKTNPRPKVMRNVNTKSTKESKLGHKSLNKKVVRKDIENIASISFITTEEFDSIPHYMLGRLDYEVINRAIADINRTIGAKYKLIVNYSTKYSDEEMRKCIKYKEQEYSETEGQYFCTIADLKELSDLKSEPTIRKVLTCLRHCKRIREIRGNPPKLVRYAVISNQMNFN